MVKDFLESVRKDYIVVETKKRQMYVMRSKLLQGVNYDEKSTSPNASDQLHKISISLIQMEEELNGEIAKIMADRIKATRMIASISNPNAMQIISKRYLENLSWEQIQKESCYSYSQMFKLCKKAYVELENNEIK